MSTTQQNMASHSSDVTHTHRHTHTAWFMDACFYPITYISCNSKYYIRRIDKWTGMCIFHTRNQVCIYSVHKILFVPNQSVCSFIPASVESRAHLASMRAAASRCLSLIHGHWTASAAIPLPPFYITYLSKKHSSYRSAPTTLPPADKLCRDNISLSR